MTFASAFLSASFGFLLLSAIDSRAQAQAAAEPSVGNVVLKLDFDKQEDREKFTKAPWAK